MFDANKIKNNVYSNFQNGSYIFHIVIILLYMTSGTEKQLLLN